MSDGFAFIVLLHEDEVKQAIVYAEIKPEAFLFLLPTNVRPPQTNIIVRWPIASRLVGGRLLVVLRTL
jgi:hypothetical protein